MASTYVNDLRLNEMGTGDGSGTWGTTTNTNLELIAEAFSYGTEGITANADTHSTTIADGATDPGRSLYVKYTGTLDSTCTVSLLPNTVSKLWIIENATSGGFNLSIKQGSGAEIVIPSGDVKVVYSDGAGTGAAIFDALVDLNIATKLTLKNPATSASPATVLLQTGDTDIAVNDVLGKIQFQAPDEGTGTDAILVAAEIAAVSEGDFAADNNATKLSFKTGASEAATEKMSLSSGGNLTLPTDAAVVNFGANSDVTLTHVHDTGLLLNAAMQLQFRDGTEYIHSSADGQLDIDSATEVQIDTGTLDINATTTVAVDTGTLDINATTIVDIDTNADSSMMTLNNAHESESEIGLLLTKASGAGYGAKFVAGTDVFLAGDSYSFYADGGELRNNNASGQTYICRFYNSDGTAKLNFYVKDDGTVNTGTDGNSPYNITTALATNCNLVGTGLMRRSTSSLRFKSNVEPIDPAWADKLLELKPINYKSTASGDGDVDSAWTFYGFGAEDVALVDPRYVFWNTHKNVHDEATGENTSVLLDEAIPEGVQYDRMVPALIDIIKRLEKRVAVLEGLN